MVKEIITDELLCKMDSGASFILLDVREREELAFGTLPHAKCIPCSTFDDFFELSSSEFLSTYSFPKPSKSDEIIVYCRSGVRSDSVARLLELRGYNSCNYVEGILGWSDVDETVHKY